MLVEEKPNSHNDIRKLIAHLEDACRTAEARGQHSKVLEMQCQKAVEKQKYIIASEQRYDDEHRQSLKVLQKQLDIAESREDFEWVDYIQDLIAEEKREYAEEKAERMQTYLHPEPRLRPYRSQPPPLFQQRLDHIQSK